MLSKKTIEELQEIWKEEFKEDIDERTTAEIARRLLGFFEIIYKVKNHNEYEKQNKQ